MTQSKTLSRSTLPSPIDAHAPAFLALQMMQLVDRITSEGSRYSAGLGVYVPVNTMSTITALEHRPATVTEIANVLNVSHVAVIKSTRTLIDQGLVTRTEDPDDGRRKPLSLTPAGRSAASAVRVILAKAQTVYAELFEEVGVDVHDVVLRMAEALDRTSFSERLDKA